MPNFDWLQLKKECEQEGWKYDRQKGSHYMMTKPGAARPIVIPRKRNLSFAVIISAANLMAIAPKELAKRMLDQNSPKRKRSKKNS